MNFNILQCICLFAAVHAVRSSKPKIAIFGGGPSGLSAEQTIAESGAFKLNLFEQDDMIGGKLIGYIDELGLAREHSCRIYSYKYSTLGSLLDRAGLEPPTTKSTPYFRQRVSTYLAPNLGNAVTRQEKLMALASSGVSPLELEYFLFQVSLFELLPASTINKLFRVPFKLFIDYFGYEQWQAFKNNCTERDTDASLYCNKAHTIAFHRFAASMMGIIVAAKPTVSTPGVMYVFSCGFRESLTPFDKLPKFSQCASHYKYFNGGYLATGPTSLRIINPWVEYITDHINVRNHMNSRLVKFIMKGSKIDYAIVKKNGKRHKVYADAYILALPLESAETILPGITKGRAKSAGLSTGFQFYLPCLPESYKQYYNSTYLTFVLESPYDAVFTLQSPEYGTWQGADIRFKKGVDYVLSVTISNFENHGILYNRSFLNNTRYEGLREILTQIQFPSEVTCHGRRKPFTYTHDDLVKKAKLGLLFKDVKDSYYQKTKDRKFKSAIVGPVKVDGRRWILMSPLYIPIPSATPISPITKYENLVLAGEYVSTPLVTLPTMAHAAESGVLAAQAAIEIAGENSGYKIPDATSLLNLVNASSVKEYDEKIENGILVGVC